MQTVLSREDIVRQIVRTVLEKSAPSPQILIPAAVSNHHVHLSRDDLDVLFGKGYELHPLRELSEKGFFAAKETVLVAGPNGALNKIRVLGPLRRETQIELLLSDGYKLGVSLHVRPSGTTGLSQPLTIIGPEGMVTNSTGIMVAWRHIHIGYQEAEGLGVKNGDEVRVKTTGDRELIFSKVKIRCGDIKNTVLHIDVDESNAAGIKTGDKVQILA